MRPGESSGTDSAPLPHVVSWSSYPRRTAALLAVVVALSIGVQVWTGLASAPAVVFLLLVVVVGAQIVLGLFDRPRGLDRVSRATSTRAQPDTVPRRPGDPDVVALVPCYNEDPAALRACLRGFLAQTRLPDGVVVVDDGSTTGGYETVEAWFRLAADELGVRATWLRQANGGKRRAQVHGAEAEPHADVYVTVDSDSILDGRALENGLVAFDDPQVQSVAAVILTTNVAQNLLTRVVDVFCVSLHLFERAAFSRLDSVMVNSGGCALYRADVIRDNVETYLGETILGRPVHFSDDSMLTLFALRRGAAVQQSNCVAFTLMPDRLGHHLRQQLRWMRGSFIRSGWRLRHLPLHRAAYWLHLAKWLMYTTVTATFFVVVLSGGLSTPLTAGSAALGAVALYSLTTLRYATIERSDRTRAQTLRTLCLAPLAGIWSLTALRVLRWYAMATFANVGWGTRASVEVRQPTAPDPTSLTG
ncbi:glycosyltransferase [Frigoribacterium sp. ACAM 257]|uniref:glycosyltransferase n=1 Tax=Frigoribacterium sp. ACAM 257 TaxID=2508998 RepID=UPI0011B9ADE1|nr:glycosyltransferase [Frigoribacterium sp. ACAM 257]TWX37247.1 glycosyltransferase [Frigoribacterium sp. ACAM 257]